MMIANHFKCLLVLALLGIFWSWMFKMVNQFQSNNIMLIESIKQNQLLLDRYFCTIIKINNLNINNNNFQMLLKQIKLIIVNAPLCQIIVFLIILKVDAKIDLIQWPAHLPLILISKVLIMNVLYGIQNVQKYSLQLLKDVKKRIQLQIFSFQFSLLTIIFRIIMLICNSQLHPMDSIHFHFLQK
ncbi:unnamed protein product [Paramecium sonneborni]|uniref:Transmembrane protein n=1 Tax=Paramecium sonneborni TaxID=65129 RepID=A0A8S1KRC6_9CILI|nr:unnamed protein product [Paramecium sonneborni]